MVYNPDGAFIIEDEPAEDMATTFGDTIDKDNADTVRQNTETRDYSLKPNNALVLEFGESHRD